MTTTTTVFDATHPFGTPHLNLVRVGWVMVPVAALVFLARLWWARHQDPGRPARWAHHPNGSITGPRLARRRIRRDMAPLIHTTRLPETGGESTALDTVADRVRPRQERRIRRWWNREAEGAFGWPSEFQSWIVWPESRTLTVSCKVIPEPHELARILHVLGVISDHEQVEIARQRGGAKNVVVTFHDATREPIVDRVTIPDGHFETDPHRPDQPARWVVRNRIMEIVTGWRWTSLYDPGYQWAEPDDTAIDVNPTPPVIAKDPSPTGGWSPVYGQGGGPLTTTTTTTIPDNDPVRLAQSQYDLARVVAMYPGRLTDIAVRVGRDKSNVRRALARLADLRLVGQVSGWWTITPAGLTVLGIPQPTPPWGPPTGTPIDPKETPCSS